MSKLSIINNLIQLVLLNKISSYKMSYLGNYIFSFWINIMPKQEVTEKRTTKKNHDKLVEKDWIQNLAIQEKTENVNENHSSVITKSTKPKVVIQSENIENSCPPNKNKTIKSMLLIVICIIILITFFISLKTYNMANEIYQYLLQ